MAKIVCKKCNKKLKYDEMVDLYYCKECDEYFLFRDIEFIGGKMKKYYCPNDGEELIYFSEMDYYYCKICDGVFSESEANIREEE